MKKNNILVAKKKIKNIRFHIGVGSENEIINYYEQINEIVNDFGMDYIFAEPVFAGDYMMFYTSLSGRIVNYSDLNDVEKDEKRFIIKDEFDKLVDEISKISDDNIKKELLDALEIPSLDNIYFINGKMVLTFWGFLSSEFGAEKAIIKNEIKEILPLKIKVSYPDGDIAKNKNINIRYRNKSINFNSGNNGEIIIKDLFEGMNVVCTTEKKKEYNFKNGENDINVIYVEDNRINDIKFNFIFDDNQSYYNKNVLFKINGQKGEYTTDSDGNIFLKEIKTGSSITLKTKEKPIVVKHYKTTFKDNNYNIIIPKEKMWMKLLRFLPFVVLVIALVVIYNIIFKTSQTYEFIDSETKKPISSRVKFIISRSITLKQRKKYKSVKNKLKVRGLYKDKNYNVEVYPLDKLYKKSLFTYWVKDEKVIVDLEPFRQTLTIKVKFRNRALPNKKVKLKYNDKMSNDFITDNNGIIKVKNVKRLHPIYLEIEGDEKLYYRSYNREFKKWYKNKIIKIEIDEKKISHEIEVFDLKSKKPIKNVLVKIGDYKKYTNDFGFAKFDKVSTYDDKILKISKKGYETKEINIKNFEKQVIFIDMNVGNLKVKVKDALNKKPLANVTVEIIDFDNKSKHEKITNKTGEVFLNDIKSGKYRIIAKKSGYINGETQGEILNNKITEKELVISKKMKDNKVRIVLEWGDNPKDLDTHLIGVSDTVGDYHMYHAKKKKPLKYNGTNLVKLDVDHTTGKGPETLTIDFSKFKKKITGKYIVYCYSGNSNLSESNAKVTIYKGSNLLKTIQIKKGKDRSYRIWNVFSFEINDQNFEYSIQNNLSNKTPSFKK